MKSTPFSFSNENRDNKKLRVFSGFIDVVVVVRSQPCQKLLSFKQKNICRVHVKSHIFMSIENCHAHLCRLFSRTLDGCIESQITGANRQEWHKTAYATCTSIHTRVQRMETDNNQKRIIFVCLCGCLSDWIVYCSMLHVRLFEEQNFFSLVPSPVSFQRNECLLLMHSIFRNGFLSNSMQWMKHVKIFRWFHTIARYELWSSSNFFHYLFICIKLSWLGRCFAFI